MRVLIHIRPRVARKVKRESSAAPGSPSAAGGGGGSVYDWKRSEVLELLKAGKALLKSKSRHEAEQALAVFTLARTKATTPPRPVGGRGKGRGGLASRGRLASLLLPALLPRVQLALCSRLAWPTDRLGGGGAGRPAQGRAQGGARAGRVLPDSGPAPEGGGGHEGAPAFSLRPATYFDAALLTSDRMRLASLINRSPWPSPQSVLELSTRIGDSTGDTDALGIIADCYAEAGDLDQVRPPALFLCLQDLAQNFE